MTVFGDPPPLNSRTGYVARLLVEITTRPGEWAAIAEYGTRKTAHGVASNLRCRRQYTVPEGEWEFVARPIPGNPEGRWGVWGRYIGPTDGSNQPRTRRRL